MADLLRNVTSNGAGSGVAMSGPSTIIVPDDVVFDGASIDIQIAVADTAADYVSIGKAFRHTGSVRCNATGVYYLRANVVNVGSSSDLTCEAVQ